MNENEQNRKKTTLALSYNQARDKERLKAPWRRRMHDIIFEADTRAGRLFDIVLLWAILASVVIVMLESVQQIRKEYGALIIIAEWIFTAIFTVEYVARIISIGRPLGYIFSFFGLVDLVAIIPTYLSLFFSGAQYFIVVRSLRLLRMFRILKLMHHHGEGERLLQALARSMPKITVFLMSVLSIVTIMGTLMYLIESENEQFSSIPRSMYWAIVTLTTVGYGDIAPITPLGQTLAALIMIMGYAIIAVPTGIVTGEMVRQSTAEDRRNCPACSRSGHSPDADYCRYCGQKL